MDGSETMIAKRGLATAAKSITSLKDTLKLPRTEFPIRSPAASATSVAISKRCTEELYSWQAANLPVESTFVLHDGPPYANGSLHIGHALNKIVKDFVCRYKIQSGHRVSYIPGWDCHGLPIELKALQAIRQDQSESEVSASDAIMKSKALSALEIRTLARELATKTVETQKAGFLGWGILGDWEHAYTTMQPAFELRQLEVFKEMLQKGLIYRRLKPVYWSPSSQTALAEAELEYNEEHISKAATIKFPLVELGDILPTIPGVNTENLGVAIWTTTPWTIPSNRAILINPEFEYSIVALEKYGQILVATSRLEHFAKLVQEEPRVIANQIPGSILLNTKYRHPLLPLDAPLYPVLPASYVTSDVGTGLVHCAPGHGPDDYLTCQKHGIPPFSPVDNEGRFTEEAVPGSSLKGLEVLSLGQEKVLEMLEAKNVLLRIQEKFKHKYPYDWRTKLPVILRATAQWFAGVEDIKVAATKSLQTVKFLPETGRARLETFVNLRSEWCISRQRSWGVPIPVLYDIETDSPLLTDESVDHIMSVFKEKGTDAWFSTDVSDEVWVSPEHQNDGRKYRRGKDTMDVWFDSGTSWKLIEEKIGRRPGKPLADVYLEGSDQHRGWFQSSLLTCIASSGSDAPQAPFGTVITHGFTLDQNMRKMSKSEGNVIDPEEIITGTLLTRTNNSASNPNKAAKLAKKGKLPQKVAPSSSTKPSTVIPVVDALRLWAAFCDFTKDVSVGDKTVRHTNESLRKFRMTGRFLLANLDDWDGYEVPYDDLLKVDQLALYQLAELGKATRSAYDEYAFIKVAHAVVNYTNVNLSAFYLDLIKDRLYASDGLERASGQTTLFYILRNFISILSPLVPHLTGEIWEHAPENVKKRLDHPSQITWFEPQAQWFDAKASKLSDGFKTLDGVAAAVKTAMEDGRKAKSMGGSLEADVIVVVDETSQVATLLRAYEHELATLFICSSVRFAASETAAGTDHVWSYSNTAQLMGTDVRVLVIPSTLHKCPRCWVHVAKVENEPCERCTGVLDRGDFGIGKLSVASNLEASSVST